MVCGESADSLGESRTWGPNQYQFCQLVAVFLNNTFCITARVRRGAAARVISDDRRRNNARSKKPTNLGCVLTLRTKLLLHSSRIRQRTSPALYGGKLALWRPDVHEAYWEKMAR
jgi:hypothetical protein